MKNITIVLLFSSLLQASPTKNEFISCQKTSVKFLDRCLDMSSNYADTSCWGQSKNTYSSCYKKVILSHDRKEQARLKAAKEKAMAALKADRLKKDSLKQMDKKPSNASHSFKVSSIGRKNEKYVKEKTIEKAKERVLDECKVYSSSNYEITTPHCSRKDDKGHPVWICVAKVTCLID